MPIMFYECQSCDRQYSIITGQGLPSNNDCSFCHTEGNARFLRQSRLKLNVHQWRHWYEDFIEENIEVVKK